MNDLLITIVVLLSVICLFLLPQFLDLVFDIYFKSIEYKNKKATKEDINELRHSIDNLEYKISSRYFVDKDNK